MARTDLVRTLDDARLAPFLPIIYLAWADGDLSDDEIEALCDMVAAADGVDFDCKQEFNAWLDPADPPSPVELNRLLDRVREAGRDIDGVARLDVTHFAEELARRIRRGVPLAPGERAALGRLSDALGDMGPEATATLLALPGPAVPAPTPRFDPAVMTELLDGPQRRAIRRRVRQLLSDPEFAYRYGLTTSEYRDLVLAWTQRLGDEGIGSLGLPPPYGGSGSMSDFIGAFTIIGHHDLSLLTKAGVQFGLFAGSIYRLGTTRHHEAYLRSAGTMELPGCFAMTETAHGSNVRALETTATFDPISDELIIRTPHDRARKDYIGNAAEHGRMAVVFAQLVVGRDNHGVHAFLVPLRSEHGEVLPGVRIEDCGPKLGLNGVDNGRIWFDGVRIPRDAMLDRFAQLATDGSYTSAIPSATRRFFTTIGTLVGGRVSVGAAAMSAAKSALAIAVRYGARRRQFGPEGGPETPILDYPLHQRRLLPRLATTYAYHFAFEQLIDDYVSTAGDARSIEATAAGLKAFGTWHTTDTIQTAREACGGAGYLTVNRLADLKADSDAYATYEGDNTVLAQLLTRSLLSDYRHEFDDLNLLGIVRFLSSRALETVREANPLVLGGSSRERLRDRGWQRDVFRWRSEHLLQALAARLRKRIDGGMDTSEAFIDVQDHVFVVARAHMEHLVLERFATSVDGVTDAGLRTVLDQLVDLYALWHVEKDRGWFQEHGQLSAAAAKAVRKEVGALCGEIRPDAVALVEGFGIPDGVLGAPIAFDPS